MRIIKWLTKDGRIVQGKDPDGTDRRFAPWTVIPPAGMPKVDAELIALAPEMSEAILVFADTVDDDKPSEAAVINSHADIYAIAERLRRISNE